MSGKIQLYQRAVIYARVSGDDRGKEGRNLAGQREMGREYAQKRGYEVVAELSEDDRGASGASFELEQLNKIHEMATAGEFDVLIVREIDRLSRNLAKQLIVEEELKRLGIRIEYVLGEYPDTPEGNLMKNIRATIAEYERLKISERNTRGRRQKVKGGHVLTHGKFPFGYRLQEREGEKRTLVIYEPEAEIVRLIFKWYTQGDGESGPMTYGEVAQRLTEMGIPTAKDSGARKWGSQKKRGFGEWGRASIQKIIKNPTYKGEWIYGKRAKVEGKWQTNPKENWLTVHVDPIVGQATWEAAQQRRQENKRRRVKKHDYLLSGRVTCGSCGLRMGGTHTHNHGKDYLYYRCTANRGSKVDTTRKCSMPMFNAEILDTMIWDHVRAFVADPEALAEGIESYRQDRRKETTPLRERLNVVDDLLEENRGQLARLLDLYLEGSFPKEMLIDRQNRLEATIHGLERERDGLVFTIEGKELTSDQVRNIKEFASKVAIGLDAAEKDFRARRQIIEALEIEVTLAAEGGERVVYLQWLPGIQQLPFPPTRSLLVGPDNTIFRDEPLRTRRKPFR